MSERTQPPEWRGDPTKGADLIAPTAPHATQASPGEATNAVKASGPARFWSTRRARIVFTVALGFSLVAHWFVAPWNLLPSNTGITVKDPGGELAIPVDIIGEDEPPPPPPPPPPAPDPPPTTDRGDDPNAPGHRHAGPPPKKPKDAGAPLDTFDAGDLDLDGGVAAATDAGPTDAGAEDSGGLVALEADGGTPGSSGPRDPASMFGLTKVVNPGTVNVVLGVNIEVIRTHPVGSRIGPVMQSLPQWRDFLKGSQSAVDPIRDTDWILIYGPSLINTDRDAVLVHYNASDQAVDQTIAGISKGYDKGGPFDAGVPGVKSSLGYADNAQRVFLRPQSKLLVIVPPSHAHEAAVTFKKQIPKGPPKNEAVRLVVKNPSNQISIRGLKFASSLTEIRFWVIPRDKDGGADVYGEGDCADEASAQDSADALTKVLSNVNSLGVRIATRGLLNNAKVVPEGKKIKLHVSANQEQLESVLQLIAAQLNVTLAPPIPPGNPTNPVSPNTPVSPPRRPNE